MSRDPFDEMRDRNPVPTDELPPAPMAMAERIMGKRARGARRPLPGFAVAAVTALAVVVAGGTLLMLTRPPADPGFADGGTTTIAPPTTTTPAPELVEVEASVFFFVDRVGDGWPGGPFLVPLAVTVETREAPEAALAAGTAQQALLRLFEGVGEHADAMPAMSSAVPSDAEFLGLEYDEDSGVVTVLLSGEFASGGGSFSMQGRLAQVVYTATAVEGVTGVRFEVDGVPTTVFGGEGVTIDDPATRDGFEDFLPAIMIESPAHGGTATNPLVASGTARVFEATVSIALTDANGLIIWEGFTTATDSVDRRGDWEVTIPYQVDTAQWGHLIVWESSAEDGRQTNVREHRVWLVSEGGTTPPTTAPAPELVEVEASVFFFVDRVGDGWPGGPFLLPLAVTVETRESPEAALAAGTAQQALLRLFEGVGEHADATPAMSSAVPSDAEFLGLEYDEDSGVVTVLLSGEFASGGGSFSMQGRLVQVVYTATAVEGVTGVRFEVDGVPTTVFGGEGVTINDPATRDGFAAHGGVWGDFVTDQKMIFLPAIMIESPAHGGTATNPLVASGTANVFEATVSIALTDANGLIIWEGFTTATDSVDRRGDWEVTIPYQVDTAQWGHLIVWESSAEDGRQTNVREHRVWLVPKG